REARMLARMRSEYVARVIDVGTLDSGAPFLVMERYEGDDLGAVLRRRGPLPIPEAVGHVVEACRAVEHAHRLGVVHRDLKPANLFLAREGGGVRIKVLDFGVAKWRGDDDVDADLTGSTLVLGTPRYMAPEQIRDARTVDGRADVWALGVILHELCA